jgi:uncharacterized protein (TIGR00375 family)
MQIADLQIHSKYSRATSKNMVIEEIAKNAKIKGLDIVGTGDFSHPIWLQELKKKLKPENEGVYSYDDIMFMLTGEISLIYKQDGKQRRVHHVIFAPSFEIVDQINAWLDTKGRRDYDGRPIFGFTSIELVENLMSISKDIEIIPAHCLVSGTFVHTNPSLKPIEKIEVGDKVFTHKGKFKKVEKIYKRNYTGKIFKIIPWYFSNGIKVTPEHPFLAIKTEKNCSWTKGLVCKPTDSHKRICFSEAYKNYRKEWVPAEELEVGDVIAYPKIRATEDVNEIKHGNLTVSVDKDFCRMAGYYLSEGYTNGRDAICFTFNENETNFIDDVKNIFKKLFNLDPKKGKNKGDILFYSRNLISLFQKLFYTGSPYRAANKSMPPWMLMLPLEKQKELFIGWWRGDKGYTISRVLASQMKNICLRLNIVPNIRIDKIEEFERRGKHLIGERKISAKSDLIALDKLSFLEDKFGLLENNDFRKFKTKRDVRHAWFDENYIFIPIRKIVEEEYNNLVYNLEVEDDNSYVAESAAVHNCWTPWYGIFGSMSGFDSLEECFGDKTKFIHSIETGMSSDPAMNWRISALDALTLTSNSDAHSHYPWRLGREANVFDLKEVTYSGIIDAIRTRKNFLFTVETSPSYGKYHYDGHRLCNFSCAPNESKKMSNICPKCGKPLTIGVLNRVEELADRPEGFVPKHAIPFKSLIPLSELIAAVLGSEVFTKKVWEIYNRLIDRFVNEFNVMLDVKKEDLVKTVDEKIANIIIQNREGRLKIEPGYDGVYGKVVTKQEKGLHKFIK